MLTRVPASSYSFDPLPADLLVALTNAIAAAENIGIVRCRLAAASIFLLFVLLIYGVVITEDVSIV